MSESSIREKFGISYLIPDDKDTEIKQLRAALSSRDAEIKEVLEGLRTNLKVDGFCWCQRAADLRTNYEWTGSHDDHCQQTRALYAKLQPKESSDVTE